MSLPMQGLGMSLPISKDGIYESKDGIYESKDWV